MNDSDFGEEDIAELAHDLYWGSDRSVNSIADQLGLSKGGLYQHILPLPAEGSCPRCGGGVGYFNRTSRDRNEPTCLALCDNEESFPPGGVAALYRRSSMRGMGTPPSGSAPPRQNEGGVTGAEGADSIESAEEFAHDDHFHPANAYDDDEIFDDLPFDDEDDFVEEVAFDLEGGFAEIAGLAGRGGLTRSDFESDRLLEDPMTEEPAPRFLEKLRSPLSQHEKKIVAGALLAGAAGLLFLRLARR